MITRSTEHWPISSCPIVGCKRDFGQTLTAQLSSVSQGQDREECFLRITSQHGGAPSSAIALRPAGNNKPDSVNRLLGCIEAEAETASLNPRCDYTIPDRAKDMARGLRENDDKSGATREWERGRQEYVPWWAGQLGLCVEALLERDGILPHIPGLRFWAVPSMRLRGKYSDQTKLYGYRHQNLIGRKLQLADHFVSFGRRR